MSKMMNLVSWIEVVLVMMIVYRHMASCMRNFAEHKNAVQSSTLFYNKFNWSADKAVDGDKEGRSAPDTSQTCSATEAVKANHTWEVDIAYPVLVNSIYVYGRSYGDQLSGFQLFIGNVSNSWSSGRRLTSISSAGNVHLFQANYSLVRFISVIRINQDILMLCEIEVNGECPDGVYSDFCNETCGSCYESQPCNKTTGECPEGCNKGWSGIHCDQECEIGKYGLGCSETCGTCLNGNNSCSTLNGQCKDGCEAGWREENCKLECDSGTYGRGCTHTCGKCLNGTSSCSKTDGQCMYGCENGWSGYTCKMVSSEKQTQSCPDVDAKAIGGSVGGICVVAIIINFITIAVLKKRMKKHTSDSKRQMNDIDKHEVYIHNINHPVHNLETSTGNYGSQEGIETADASYEELQDRGRISSSTYCKINETEKMNQTETV